MHNFFLHKNILIFRRFFNSANRLELNDSTFAEINAQAAYRLACYYVNPNQIIKPNMAKGKKYLEQSKKWAELSNDTTLLFKIKQSLETFK